MDDKTKARDETPPQNNAEHTANGKPSATGWSTQINDKVEKSKKGRVGRILKRLIAAVLIVAVLFVAWGYLSPMVTADTVTTYDSYTTQTGSIATTMSYSGTISVRYQETLRNDKSATVSAIYVSEGDSVKKGDAILALSTGVQLTAGMDGIVNAIEASLGDWLWRSRDLVQICNLTDLEVALTVDEYDVLKVAVGQKCTVTIISTGDVFETEIAHINRVSSATGSVATYSAAAYMTVPESILPGMAATVTMAADSVENAVLLDLAALSFHDDGTAYVLQKRSDGTYAVVDVTTGLSDGMQVEIVSGLTAGQEVWVATGTESVSSGYTLSDIYQAIAGQTIVINESSQRGSGRSGSNSGFTPPTADADVGQTPDGMTLPEGADMPTLATGTDMGQMPEGMTLPEGFTPPDGAELPEGFTPSSGDPSDSSGESAQRQRPDGAQQRDTSSTSGEEAVNNTQGGNGE